MNLFHKLAMAGSGSSGGSSSGSTDPYLNRTSILLHGNGTNGAQNSSPVDSSASALTVTRASDASMGTFTPFSHDTNYWSTYYSANAYRTYVSSWSTSIIDVKSTATFTVEGWIMLTGAAASYYAMVCTTDFGSTVNWSAGVNSSRQVNFYWYVGGVFNCTGTTVLNYYQWYFIQLRCNNGVITLGLNGVAETLTGTTTLGNPGNTTYLSFGCERSFNNPCFLYDVRISNVVRSYTLPTQPQSTDANTTFLGLRKKTYTDESSLANTLTNTGVNSPYSPFGTGRATPYNASTIGGSMWFDGASDYVTVGGSSAIAIGSSDFIIETWIYFNAAASQIIFYDGRDTLTQATPCLYYNTSTIHYYVSGSDRIVSNTTIVAGTWYHIVVSRVSGTTRMFINGLVQTQTYADSTVYINQTNRPVLGTAGDSIGGGPLNGYMTGVRLVVGSGVTSVTVPTAPAGANDIANTKLLLNFTTGGIIDSTGRGVVETVSTANVNTSVVKFGTGSMKFNGSSDFLYLPVITTHTVLNLLGDFTVEFWMYVTSIPDCCFVHLSGNTGSYGAIRLNLYAAGAPLVLLASTNGSAWQINAGSANGVVSINTWYHIAIVRNGGTFTVYQNGAAIITSTAIAASTALMSGTINYIGAINSGGATYFIPGYMDEFRVTQGLARYTAPFTSTVPTAAFGDK
jgi:hypothetical protein